MTPGVLAHNALTPALRSSSIIDRITIIRSYNFSAGAALDSEDLNITTSEEVADAYARHWQARQAGSVRFGDRAE